MSNNYRPYTTTTPPRPAKLSIIDRRRRAMPLTYCSGGLRPSAVACTVLPHRFPCPNHRNRLRKFRVRVDLSVIVSDASVAVEAARRFTPTPRSGRARPAVAAVYDRRSSRYCSGRPRPPGAPPSDFLLISGQCASATHANSPYAHRGQRFRFHTHLPDTCSGANALPPRRAATVILGIQHVPLVAENPS
jgi:hypothetical protein